MFLSLRSASGRAPLERINYDNNLKPCSGAPVLSARVAGRPLISAHRFEYHQRTADRAGQAEAAAVRGQAGADGGQ
jgi:hypothetical protein